MYYSNKDVSRRGQGVGESEGDGHGPRRDREDKVAVGGGTAGEPEGAQAGASAFAIPEDGDGQERQRVELRGGQELRSARHPPNQKIHLPRVQRTLHPPLEGLIEMKLIATHTSIHQIKKVRMVMG